MLPTTTEIIELLRKEIEAYDGPLPATGDSIQEVWFREAVQSLRALEASLFYV